MVIIPWTTAPAWRQEIVLDKTVFVFSAKWNPESEKWTLDIADRNSRPLVSSIRVVAGLPLLRLHKYGLPVPMGDLFVTGEQDPDYTGFQTGKNQMLYLTAEDIRDTI